MEGALAIRPRMALVGYARVSTRDQQPQAQTDALTAAGCTRVFVEHAPGTLAKRLALEQALDYLREGGPEFKMTPNRARQARVMYDARQHTVQVIADTFGVSRPTIYRHLGGTAAAPPVPH